MSKARFSDFKSPTDSSGVRNSDLAPLGMKVYFKAGAAVFSKRWFDQVLGFVKKAKAGPARCPACRRKQRKRTSRHETVILSTFVTPADYYHVDVVFQGTKAAKSSDNAEWYKLSDTVQQFNGMALRTLTILRQFPQASERSPSLHSG